MVVGQEKHKAFQGNTKVIQIVFNTGDIPLSHVTFVFLGFSSIQLLVFV